MTLDGEPGFVRTGRYHLLAAVALLTPAGYVSNLLVVRWLQGFPLKVRPLLSTQMLLYVAVLALTGTIAVLARGQGLRRTFQLAVVGLIAWPWVYTAVPVGNVGYVSVLFVVVLLVTLGEATLRFPERIRQLLTGSTGRYALAAGFGHFLIGFGIQIVVRQFYWLDTSFPGPIVHLAIQVVAGTVLVAIGAASVVLWHRRRLITPSLATAGWLAWGLYGTWKLRRTLPWGDFTAIDWTSLQPYPDYMYQWTVLVVVVLVVAGGETLVRRGLGLVTGASPR